MYIWICIAVYIYILCVCVSNHYLSRNQRYPKNDEDLCAVIALDPGGCWRSWSLAPPEVSWWGLGRTSISLSLLLAISETASASGLGAASSAGWWWGWYAWGMLRYLEVKKQHIWTSQKVGCPRLTVVIGDQSIGRPVLIHCWISGDHDNHHQIGRPWCRMLIVDWPG